MKKWNKWYAYADENGSVEWDDVKFDTFESWALSGYDRDHVFRAVIGTAREFCNNMVEVAIAEQRHIPYKTRADFFGVCVALVERWNREAIEKPWEH